MLFFIILLSFLINVPCFANPYTFSTDCCYKNFNMPDKFEENFSTNKKLYILVSGSLKSKLIKQYMKDAKKYKGIVVMKGLVENDLKKTIKFLFNLKQKPSDQQSITGGIMIDPRIFKKFAIDKVPAIILIVQDKDNVGSMRYDKIYGAITIKYALEQFAKSGDTKDVAKEILSQIY